MDTDKWINGIIAVMVAVVALATTSVFFSKKADTANVIKESGNAFAQVIKAAVSPVA